MIALVLTAVNVIWFPGVPLEASATNSLYTPLETVTESPAAATEVAFEMVSHGEPDNPELASFPDLETKYDAPKVLRQTSNNTTEDKR